jgi:membrane protease YdiL (CAAX protease family)
VNRATALLFLALCPLTSSAQVSVGVAAEVKVSPAVGPAIIAPNGATTSPIGVTLPSGALSLSLAPAPSVELSVNQVALTVPIGATPIAGAVPIAAIAVKPLALEHPSHKVTPSVAVLKSAPAAALTRSEKAIAVVRDEVANWGVARHPEDSIPSALSHSFTSLSPVSAAASTPETRDAVSAPMAAAPNPAHPGLAQAALMAGIVFLGTASLSLFLPLLSAAVPLLTALGILALGAAKFFQKPTGAPAVPAAASVASRPLPAWITRYFGTFLRMGRSAGAALKAHERFEGQIGAGSPKAFRQWLASGLRASLYWTPATLLAMFAGSMASMLPLVTRGLTIGSTGVGKQLIEGNWLHTFSSFMADSLVLQFALLGGVFAGARTLLARAGVEASRAAWVAGALSVAAYAALLLANGNALWTIMPILAIQAVLAYVYARSKTLLVPLGITAIIGTSSLYSGRMLSFLLHGKFGSIDSLPGIPGFWGVLSVFGVSAALFAIQAAKRYYPKHGWSFLKAAAQREWFRLKAVGRWWNKPNTDGVLKSPIPILSVGFLWGIGVYLSSYLVYWGTSVVLPGHEIIPEILKRTLMMPLDALIFIFIIGAALEEWLFRKGLFALIRNKLMNAKVDAGNALLAGAVLSSVIFSLFHLVSFAPILQALHIRVPAEMLPLLDVYSASWAGSMGRISAGLLLVALFHRSKVLLIGLTAHFASNLLEAVGLRWGLSWFLAAVVAIFLFQAVGAPKTPKSLSMI